MADIINQNKIYRSAKGDILHRNATGTFLDKTFTLTGYEYSFLVPAMGVAMGVAGFMLSKKKGFKGNKRIGVIGGLAVLGLVIASQIQKPVPVQEYTPTISTANEETSDNMDVVEDLGVNNLTGDIIKA